MDGFLLLNKPVGISSAACVARIKKTFKLNKVGHTGTLDPFAEGLLVIAVGKATKEIPHLPKTPKVYEATLKLGEETDTLDTEGKVIDTQTIPSLSKLAIQQVMSTFIGSHQQIPPLYSAIKVKGQALYRYARKGKTEGIVLPPRCIDIFSFSLAEWQPPLISFKVVCSPGTYVRSLGRDLAHALGTCGHLIFLRRLESDGFFLRDAQSLDELVDSASPLPLFIL